MKIHKCTTSLLLCLCLFVLPLTSIAKVSEHAQYKQQGYIKTKKDKEPVQVQPKPESIEDDPFENYNRHAYHLNDTFDRVILKPIASIYKTAVPWPLRRGVSNFFGNLRDLTTIPNDLLQAKFFNAYRDTWRVLVNTTIGIGGLVDVSSKIGLEKNPVDLGLTFAHWGYKKSSFFIIPLLGPSTVRDTIALPFNWAYLTVYPYIGNVPLRNQLWAFEQISERADILKYEKLMVEASYDPYVFQRNAYMHHRQYLVEGGKESGAEEDHDVYEEDRTGIRPIAGDIYYGDEAVTTKPAAKVSKQVPAKTHSQ